MRIFAWVTGRDVRDVNWRQAVPETWMTCTTRRAATAGTQLTRMLSHARAREENRHVFAFSFRRVLCQHAAIGYFSMSSF